LKFSKIISRSRAQQLEFAVVMSRVHFVKFSVQELSTFSMTLITFH